jgi:hypothetical protein
LNATISNLYAPGLSMAIVARRTQLCAIAVALESLGNRNVTPAIAKEAAHAIS